MLSSTGEHDHLALLSAASRTLDGSLDYETTLTNVARLALPRLGCWCIVDVCDADGAMRRLAVIHPDTDRQVLVRALQEGWPPAGDDVIGVPVVTRARGTVVISHVTDALLSEVARTPENIRILCALGIGSLLTVPMVARDAVLGAITFVSTESGFHCGGTSVALAEEFASRAAVAAELARLSRDTLKRAEAEAARAVAEAANAAKVRFLATMSHELRTPLHAIAGCVQLLEMDVNGSLSEAQRALIQRIVRNERHVMALVDDVMTFARIEAGQLHHHLTAVPLGEMVKDLQEMAQASLEIQGITLKIHACAADLVALTDREKSAQVLLNLVSNAVKFTPAGGTIDVECQADDRLVVIRVRDTGPGIPPEKFEIIFEPFVQVEPRPLRPNEGSGLGLAISRDLARALGGDITVESTLGVGTVFAVRLPRAFNPTGAGGDT